MTDHPANDDPARPDSEVEWLREQIASFERRLDELTGDRRVAASRPPRMPSAQPTPAPAMSQVPRTPPPPQMPPPPTAPMPLAPPRWTPADSDRPGLTPSSPRDEYGFPARGSEAANRSERQRSAMSLPGIESLLKWAGLVLLFLSAVFLVSTAIQRGWIGPELQLLGAACIGASLIGGGLVLGQRRAGWDVPLVGVGVAILSATATAGWDWLDLWSPELWIVASFLVLAVSITLNGRLRSPGVAATGLVTTAISMGVLSDSIQRAAVLLALVVAVGEATSVWRRSASLHLMTVVVGLVSFGSLAAVSYIEDEPTSVALLLSGALVTLMFWLMPLVFDVREVEPSPLGVNWRPTVNRLVISLPALFSVAWSWSLDLSDGRAGRVFLLSGGLALASAAVVASSRRFERSIWASQLMGGAAAVTVGWVLLFEGPGLLAGLTVQAAALLVFVRLVPDRWALVQAGAMAAVAGLLALAGMVDAVDVDAPIIDDAVHLGVIALLAGWAWWEDRSRDSGRLGQFLGAGALGGAVLWPISALIHVAQGQGLISATWAAIGFGLLALAFSRSSIRLAQISLVTLGVVVAKLLTVDLETVDVFWRVALFFVLGGTFLFASFRVGTAIRLLSPDDGRPDSPDQIDPVQNDPDQDDPSQNDPGQDDPGQDSGLAFQK